MKVKKILLTIVSVTIVFMLSACKTIDTNEVNLINSSKYNNIISDKYNRDVSIIATETTEYTEETEDDTEFKSVMGANSFDELISRSSSEQMNVGHTWLEINNDTIIIKISSYSDKNMAVYYESDYGNYIKANLEFNEEYHCFSAQLELKEDNTTEVYVINSLDGNLESDIIYNKYKVIKQETAEEKYETDIDDIHISFEAVENDDNNESNSIIAFMTDHKKYDVGDYIVETTPKWVFCNKEFNGEISANARGKNPENVKWYYYSIDNVWKVLETNIVYVDGVAKAVAKLSGNGMYMLVYSNNTGENQKINVNLNYDK